ncbi:MAG: nitrate reductase molybdenum cofactor assembly chaperone [Actinomycetales bacterium]|nr:nitrate reductase molybdenum cofactor assembly chaperone [Actinomycetales bacterium]
MRTLLTGWRSRQRDEATEQALVYRLAALLLDYPDEAMLAGLGDLRAGVEVLEDPARSHLRPVVEFLADTDPQILATQYVDTFDLKKQCALYLTYYSYGDTRKRGMALLDFKSAYRQSGLELAVNELPDHLGVVLEFAATQDLAWGRELLTKHRAGLEILRLALRDTGSPYAGVLAAVCSTLPHLAGEEHAAIARLVAEGPPGEEVGLEPFGPPESMGERR